MTKSIGSPKGPSPKPHSQEPNSRETDPLPMDFQQTLLVMAHPTESQGLFSNSEFNLLYTGIGKINATFSLTQYLVNAQFNSAKITRVLNLGTAGSSTLEPHQIIECTTFVQRDMNLSSIGVPVGKTPLDPLPPEITVLGISNYPKGICATGDSVDLNPPPIPCDVVDMEAYALASVCRRLHISFHSLKYITDRSDSHTQRDWKQNLKDSAKALYNACKTLPPRQ